VLDQGAALAEVVGEVLSVQVDGEYICSYFVADGDLQVMDQGGRVRAVDLPVSITWTVGLDS
jgi:hypothetical protein